MSEPNMIETVGEGAKVISKFEEITQMLLGPITTRWQSKAAIKAAQKQIDFIRENPDMEIAFSENGSVATRERTPQELYARGIIRETGDMIYQQKNLESITEKAQSMISEAEDPKETIDVDWLMRFKDAAKNISAEEMQFLWAKILAGEYETPGSISLRTLDVVRNLSREEAELFQKIMPFIILCQDGGIVSVDEKLLKKYGYSQGELINLDFCGLVRVITNTERNDTIEANGDNRSYHTNNLILIVKNKTELEYKLKVDNIFMMTYEGIELLKLLEYRSNDQFFMDWSQHIRDKNRGHELEFSLHRRCNDNEPKQYTLEVETIIEETSLFQF